MFALIGWIGRFLLILFVVRLVLRFFMPTPIGTGPGAGGAKPRGPFGARQPQQEHVGGQLVRDPQCGTYVPESSAIKVTRGGETLHFCSDTCRDAYAAAHA